MKLQHHRGITLLISKINSFLFCNKPNYLKLTGVRYITNLLLKAVTQI